MSEDQPQYGQQQQSTTDALKRKVIDFAFSIAIKATAKEEEIAGYTYETGFVRGVRLLKSMLWKYTPTDIRSAVSELYAALEEKIKQLDTSGLSEPHLTTNKQMVADDVSMQVLEFMLVVLQYSPLSTEYKEMQVLQTDFETLIKAIRVREPVKLFSGELNQGEVIEG